MFLCCFTMNTAKKKAVTQKKSPGEGWEKQLFVFHIPSLLSQYFFFSLKSIYGLIPFLHFRWRRLSLRTYSRQRAWDSGLGAGAKETAVLQGGGQGDQEVCGLLRGDVRAGQGQQRRGIAEEVVDDVGATEGQSRRGWRGPEGTLSPRGAGS